MTTLLDAAREYHALVLSVIPVARTKIPFVKWDEFQTERTHPDQIDEWWTRWPDANVGVVTGAISGLVVLDADGAEGLASLKTLNPPATTWLQKTGRLEGGWQLFLRHPGEGVTIPNRAGLLPGLDVRGDGGYVVVPPSCHTSGQRYTWLTPPWGMKLAEISPALLVMLTAPSAQNGAANGATHGAGAIPAGQRNDTLYRLGRSLVAKGLSDAAVTAALLEENQARCRPPLPEHEVRAIAAHVTTQPDRNGFTTRAQAERNEGALPLVRAPRVGASAVDLSPYLYDGADAWDFPDVKHIVEHLLPMVGVVWVGGLPKQFKSMLLLYVCLAIACRRSGVGNHFAVHEAPRILYIAREDGGSRVKQRRDEILAAWRLMPAPGAIRFLIRPRLDLLNAEQVAWVREMCQREGITLLVLDTWTALSPSADPMGAKDQAVLAAVVVQLAEDLGGTVIVVDHSRKNRPEGQDVLSSADIFGPLQKWAAAEHIIMLRKIDNHRVEVFVEGKDVDTTRFFLAVSPRDSREEKFTYAGSIDEIADAQREKGTQNRDAVHRLLLAGAVPMTLAKVAADAKAHGLALAETTLSKHLRALAKDGRARRSGKGPATRYLGIASAPLDAITSPGSELFDGARS